jgi:D-amino peptidase
MRLLYSSTEVAMLLKQYVAGAGLVVACAWSVAATGDQAQPQRLKVLISVDMEGIAGVVTGEQLGPAGFEYSRFREFMTREALAAVNGARAAGATEVIVGDAHGNGQNLLIDQFPADVRVIRSWPRRLGMVAGVEDKVDALIYIGYHAGTNNTTGVRAHTFSSANLTRVALNGTNVTEGSWNAAIAGHFNVPVVMISGDDAAIAEVRTAIGNIEAVETKKSLGFHAANTITPKRPHCSLASACGRRSGDEPSSNPIEWPARLRWTCRSRITCRPRCSPISRCSSAPIRTRSGFERGTWSRPR